MQAQRYDRVSLPEPNLHTPAYGYSIIAVSGLSSHPFGSWKARGGTFMWLRDELTKNADRARILLYGYDTTLVNSESFQDIDDIATRLSSDISAMRSKRISHASIVPIPIIFIAHSLGGLIVKKAIHRMSKEYHDDFLSVYALLFFGVPNGGIETKYWMPIVDRMPNKSLIESLQPGASYLKKLQDNFNEVFNFDDARLLSIYETMQSPTAKEESTGVWKLTGPPDILVTRESAKGRHSKRLQHTPIPFNQTHSDLPKFISKFDPNYKVIESFFNESYGDAFGVIQERFIDQGSSRHSLRIQWTNLLTNQAFLAIQPTYSVNSKHGNRLECSICGMAFKLQFELLQHLRGNGNGACHFQYVRYCVEKDQVSMIRMLLAGDERIEAPSYRTGGTVLHFAAHIGHVNSTELLLDLGANVNATSIGRHRPTPLHIAARRGNVDVVDLLLRRKAKIEAVTSEGATPLEIAAGAGQAAVVELLLKGGANVGARNGVMETPLHLAAWGGDVETARLLINRGARIHVADSYGRTPLSHAAAHGHEGLANLLLKHGARIEVPDMDGATPVDHASMSGQKHMVQLLLDHGYRAVGTPRAPRPRPASWNGKTASFKSWFNRRAQSMGEEF
ncbi:ankyrin repeat [Trichoderma arundinaceum]|uniref:Ankyrin repeat n=1 Tax=Trichoderma arundinaceum TaxID=490622 RepID=A0A395NU22_TRIAR|nr:ankyrin repeat [Trichoderma arundinaceum]